MHPKALQNLRAYVDYKKSGLPDRRTLPDRRKGDPYVRRPGADLRSGQGRRVVVK
jgi:hypothetical protein